MPIGGSSQYKDVCQDRDLQVKDKTVSRPGIPIPGKDGLYIETGPRLIVVSHSIVTSVVIWIWTRRFNKQNTFKKANQPHLWRCNLNR